jgi:uncharacterized LabA/DUF88 family protein
MLASLWTSEDHAARRSTPLSRVSYYDARPFDEREMTADIKSYTEAVELLHDVHVSWGILRPKRGKKPAHQKAVDTLVAVDMVVGAFTEIYSVALLISGDADFLPVIEEVSRRGVMVVVCGEKESVASELIAAADRFLPMKPRPCSDRHELPHMPWPPLLRPDGGGWPTGVLALRPES